jgi:hypothetical protein
LSQLSTPETSAQLPLLEAAADRPESARDRALAQAVDAVREKYGPNALGRGGVP